MMIEQQRKWNIGTMITASCFSVGRKHHYELPVAIDNGAFSAWKNGNGFDEWKFLKLLSAINDKKLKYDFMVTPDIVAGGKDSLFFSLAWVKRLGGWKRQYFAVQDGMDSANCGSLILSGKPDGVFIGGTTEWKWKTAQEWVTFAHENGLKCHIGRCGTLERLLYAYDIGVDSVDSTNFSRNANYSAVEAYHRMRGLSLFTIKGVV